MNPQNVGQQIKLKHSSLWRQPLHYERPVPSSQGCHKQLNELGATGLSWRLRNNSIATHSAAFHPARPTQVRHSLKTTSKRLRELLREDDKQPEADRSLVRSLKTEAERIDRSRLLVEGMGGLRKLGLLGGRGLERVCLPGVLRYEHIHNDYHERVTNPGFSRNHLGRFYTK